MSLRSLDKLARMAELLSVIGADLSSYDRWRARRWEDVKRALSRYTALPAVEIFVAQISDGLHDRLMALVEAGQAAVAADGIADFIETLCCQAQARHARLSASMNERTAEVVPDQPVAASNNLAAAA